MFENRSKKAPKSLRGGKHACVMGRLPFISRLPTSPIIRCTALLCACRSFWVLNCCVGFCGEVMKKGEGARKKGVGRRIR